MIAWLHKLVSAHLLWPKIFDWQKSKSPSALEKLAKIWEAKEYKILTFPPQKIIILK